MNAAAVAFAERGYAATSMDDVAAAAGITKLIVYRHFASKQELYDAVLEGVAQRTRDRFLEGLDAGEPAMGAVRALLAVARENPAGFALLWRHAAREPQFSEHAELIRERGVRVAERLLEPVAFGTPRLRRWAAATVVSYLVGAVLNWLDHGDPTADEDVGALLAESVVAMVSSWRHARESLPR